MIIRGKASICCWIPNENLVINLCTCVSNPTHTQLKMFCSVIMMFIKDKVFLNDFSNVSSQKGLYSININNALPERWKVPLLGAAGTGVCTFLQACGLMWSNIFVLQNDALLNLGLVCLWYARALEDCLELVRVTAACHSSSAWG